MKISFTYEFDGENEKIMRDHWKEYKREGETFKEFLTGVAWVGLDAYVNQRNVDHKEELEEQARHEKFFGKTER